LFCRSSASPAKGCGIVLLPEQLNESFQRFPAAGSAVDVADHIKIRSGAAGLANLAVA
jgi:hypothetical protein